MKAEAEAIERAHDRLAQEIEANATAQFGALLR